MTIYRLDLTTDELQAFLARPNYQPIVYPLAFITAYFGVKPQRVCTWAARGHITRHHGGYDLLEVELRLRSIDPQRLRHAQRALLPA